MDFPTAIFAEALSCVSSERETRADAQAVWELIAKQVNYEKLLQEVPDSFIQALQWEFMTSDQWERAFTLRENRPTDRDANMAMDRLGKRPVRANLADIVEKFGLAPDNSFYQQTLSTLAISGRCEEMSNLVATVGAPPPEVADSVVWAANARLNFHGASILDGDPSMLLRPNETRAKIEACIRILQKTPKSAADE